MKNFLRRAGALAAAVMMCFALAVPAAAAGESLVEGSAGLWAYASQRDSNIYNDWFKFNTSIDYSVQSGGSQTMVSDFSYARRFGLWGLGFSSDSATRSGEYGIYLSFYYASTAAASQNHVPTSDDFLVSYVPADTGTRVEVPVKSVSLFAPSSSFSSLSDGCTVTGRLNNSVASPFQSGTQIYLQNGVYNTTMPRSWTFDSESFRDATCQIVVTSYRLVYTSSSSELDQLEDIANSIAAQSEILSAFYGDIVAICNEIYQRLGDMQQTQEEANALLSSLISLLNTTNSKISSLNQAMSTYFELVLKSLANESLSIQDCIDDAEARLELYLKPMIDYFVELEEQTGESAATLPQHKTDIDGFDNQGYGIDGDGQAGLAALLPIFGSFSWIFSVIAIFIGVGIINLLVKKGMS